MYHVRNYTAIRIMIITPFILLFPGMVISGMKFIPFYVIPIYSYVVFAVNSAKLITTETSVDN